MSWRLLYLFDCQVLAIPEPKQSNLLDNCYVFYLWESAFFEQLAYIVCQPKQLSEPLMR